MNNRDKEEYHQKRFKLIFNQASDPFYITDLEGNFIDCNRALEKLIGYNKLEIVDKSFHQLDLFSEKDIARAQRTLEKNKKKQSVGMEEYTLIRKDNQKITVEIFTCMADIAGNKFILAIIRDITRRKKAEEKIKKYAEAIKSSMDGMAILNEKEEYVFLNEAHAKIYGYDSPEELIGKNWRLLYHQEEIKRFENEIMVKLREKRKWLGEATGRKKDGSKFSQEVSLSTLEDNGIICVVRDITHHKQAEQRTKLLIQVIRGIRNVNKLILREKDLDILIQKACNLLVENQGYHNTWIVLLDEDKKYLTSAQAGYGPAFEPMRIQLENSNWPRCVREALQRKEILITDNPKSACDNCPLSHNLQNRSAYTTILRYGNTVYGVFSTCIPKSFVEDKEEQALFKETGEDIALALYGIKTEKDRREAVESLRKSNERFRVALKNSPIVVWSQDKDLRYNWIYNPNPAFKPEDFLGKKDEDMFPADDARVLTKIKQKVISTGKDSTAEVRTTIKGKPFFYQLVTEPLKDAQGNIIGITCASIDITEFRGIQRKLERALDITIETMSKIVEIRDPYTSGHQSRVSQLATRIAQELNLSREKIKEIEIAALIHDIGKIAIPSEILTKPSKLSDIEFSLIKNHPQTGYDILKDTAFSSTIIKITLQHHERMNGSGYPQGLKGDDILLEAKIIAVADVVEAISSHRPYRPALGIDAALEEITKNKGILYDPEVVDVCIRLFREKEFEFK